MNEYLKSINNMALQFQIFAAVLQVFLLISHNNYHTVLDINVAIMPVAIISYNGCV